jgi:hypothetical protein
VGRDPRLRVQPGRRVGHRLVGFAVAPGALVAPVASSLGDRYRRSGLLLGYATQAITILATAVAMLADLPLVVYAIATVAMASFTVSRPAHHSLLPRLATTPEELMAANSMSSLAEGLGVTLGAATVAVLLAFSGLPRVRGDG